MIVRFDGGKEFEVREDGTANEVEGKREDVLVVSSLDEETVKKAEAKDVKLFLCNKEEEVCISLLVNAVFKRPKACKFS
ncbi:MAG: hypothetical protein TQ35_0004680 [Candidatus Aramenus sulfurataquae]|uniref:Uncharacterized protein n=2 Tax=Candidatus Aramenus sulfurataquae TaxID=1326980 RepID=A0AAE3FMT3_9CREN|nr:hypothetical protein [Candidatus Aramenus sulfurataquae]